MNEDAYFREATLRICGSLEIGNALSDLRRFLADSMPVSHIFLQHYDPQYQAMRSIAYASESESGKLDLLTPLSKSAREKVTKVAPAGQDAFLISDPGNFPVSREMTAFHGIKSSSVIVMALRSDENMLGYVVFTSEGEQVFNEEHRSYVEQLKEPLMISMSNVLQHRQVIKLNELLADDNQYLHDELRRISGDELVGARFGLREITRMINQVAKLDSPVLLLGETGTGKDVIANGIHYSSSRNNGPFVSVNCGGIPESLMDSELFGHEKGAFTGALSKKRGRFERAHGGTIFLDEIGELPLQAQTRLLRVLQNKEIERVGGVDTISLDIRVIAATNRDLAEMVRNGQFREDLWFRLNIFPIVVPPLRERTVDIPALIQHFISLKAKELKLGSIPVIAPGAIESLMHYRWPGNVRELQNVVERALILKPEGPITFEHLGVSERPITHSPDYSDPEPLLLDEVTARHIKRVLGMTKGKVNGSDGAAAMLGINPSTLRNRMKKLGIPYGRQPA
ncbi:MAG: AAA family ATPase [Desulfobulbaceae bacterium]|nr:MAG: AAA family ATPase [Desulfobulbaceae bacterium]